MDYLIADNLCRKAIEVYNNQISMSDWESQYSALYNSIAYGPDGLARIASSNFEGEHFKNIQSFFTIYNSPNNEY